MKSNRFNRFYDRMDGIEFEEYCAKLLRKNGYKDVNITLASRDQGIDITCSRHAKTYGIQCKNYQGPVGNKAVQEAFAGKCYYKLDFGVVLTNNYFTKPAIDLAEQTDIILWDRDKLDSLRKGRGLLAIISGILLSAAVIGILYLVIFEFINLI